MIYVIIFNIVFLKGVVFLKENLKQIGSADLKEMYNKNSEMKKFLDKEYRRVFEVIDE